MTSGDRDEAERQEGGAGPSTEGEAGRLPADVDAFEQCRSGMLAALVAVSDFVRVDRVLGAQVPEGRRSFFGHSDPEEPSAARANRFLEWFTLERKADGSGGPPIEAFVAAGAPGLDAAARPFARALADSRTGIWAIRERDGDLLELESADAGDERRVLLWMPARLSQAGPGQTVIGRLLPVPPIAELGLDEGDERFLASDGTSLFAGTAVFDAYAEELTRRELAGGAGSEHDERHGGIDPLEIEQILAAHEESAGESPERVEQELEALLSHEGCEKLASAAELSYALSVASSPGRVLGPFLEELAFSTDVDIERAQRVLLRLWNAHRARQEQSARGDAADAADASTPGATAAAPASPDAAAEPARIPPAELGAKLVSELEKGLAEGQEVEALFGKLESMIGETAGGASPELDTPEELRWHTEDEGDFAALVEEYLWERGQGEHPASPEHGAELREICARAATAGVRSVDALHESHVASMLVEDWARGQEAAWRARLDVLAAWHEWLLASQEIELGFDPSALRDELREAAERCEALRAQITDAGLAEGEAPVAWHVSRTRDGAWICRHGTRELRFDEGAAFELGDLVLGEVPREGERFAPGARILPPRLARTIVE